MSKKPPAPKAQRRVNPFYAEDNYGEFEKALERFDPAWAKAALFFRSDCELHFGHGDNLRTQELLAIHTQLEGRRKRFEAGAPLELLFAIKLCAEENLPLPTWLALAFNERFASIGRVGGPTSLDAVFHSDILPTSTPQKAEQARKDWERGGRLWLEVWRIAERHSGLDTAIAEVLRAGRYGMGKTKARELISRIDELQHTLTGQTTLSQFWAKRRKALPKR